MNKVTKEEMLSVLSELRKTIQNEKIDLNTLGVRMSLVGLLNALEAYTISREGW